MVSTKAASLIPLILLAPRIVAAVQADEDQFSAAAGALISSYIQIPLISSPIAAAASAASVTGDVASLVTSALEAPSVPAWFLSAVPTEYKSNIDAAISDISVLRAAAGVAVTETGNSGTATFPPTAQQTTVVSTGTDSAGNTFTTSIVSAITAPPTSTSASTSGSASSSASGSTAQSGSGSSSTTSTSSGRAAPVATAMPGRVVAGAAALVGLVAVL